MYELITSLSPLHFEKREKNKQVIEYQMASLDKIFEVVDLYKDDILRNLGDVKLFIELIRLKHGIHKEQLIG